MCSRNAWTQGRNILNLSQDVMTKSYSVLMTGTNTYVSSANIFMLHFTISGMSFTLKRNRTRPRTLPWGTPLLTGPQFDRYPSTSTLWALPLRKSLIHPKRLPRIPQELNLSSRLSWGTLSNAFAKSR